MRYTLLKCTIVSFIIGLLFSCNVNVESTDNIEYGTIIGKAYYSNSTDASGINISLESTDGLRALSVSRAIQAGEINASTRSIVSSDMVESDGCYTFTNVLPGTYTLYASSNTSSERAVTTNVQVYANRTVTADDLKLTATGCISGKVTLDYSSTNSYGFIVYVASTSFSAMTGLDGKFSISGVPAGTDYSLIISKGEFTYLWKTGVSVNAGQTTNIISKNFTTEEVSNGFGSITWKGSLSSAPSNPQIGWAYYNTIEKCSYIYDGSSWQLIAQDGKSVEWKGELASAPVNPEENWAYFNIIDGNSYIYTGTEWNYLAKSGRDGASGIMLWLGTLASAPQNPSSGYCYYNSSDGCSYIWDGDSWEVLAKDGTNGTSGTSIVWKGVLSFAPSNPELCWAYYNSTNQTSYIWNGTRWDTLAESLGGDTTVQVPVNWLGEYVSAPSTPSIGDAYYNSTLKASFIYDGSIWNQISKDGQDGTYTYEGTGYLITWKGTLSKAPSNPAKGWAYYNSSEGKSYVYDGSAWQIMSKDGLNGSGGSVSNAEIKIYVNGTESNYYQFGTYDYGNESDAIVFTIKNTGASTLNLTDSNIFEYLGGLYDYKDQFVIDISKTSSSIAAGGTTTFTVKFKPTKAVSNCCMTIYFPSNAKNGTATFYFYGSCKAPDLYFILTVNGTQHLGYPYMYDMGYAEYEVKNVDFGTTYVNTPVTSTAFMIQNAGVNSTGTTLKLTRNITISGQDADSFIVTQPDTTSIVQGTSVSAKLAFSPTSVGRKTATVTIYTNAPGREIYSFTVTGNCLASSSTGSPDPDPEDVPAPKWPKYFDGGEGDGNDVVICSAHDSLGNLYFVGYGYELVNNHSGYDWWIKKFSKDGDEIITGWNKQLNYYDDYSKNYDVPGQILIDNNNDVIIISKYNAVKFSANGTLLWEKSNTKGNFKKIYGDSNANTYLVTDKETMKINNLGTVEWTIADTAPIVFDSNDNFALYKNSKISYYSSTANLISEFECIDTKTTTVDESGWVNSSVKSEDDVCKWVFPVKSGTTYAIQMNNRSYGDGTKSGSVYLRADYVSSGNQIFSDDYSMFDSPNTFTPSSNDSVCIKSSAYNSSYFGPYAFRVLKLGGKNISVGWNSGSVTTGTTEKKYTYSVEAGKTYLLVANDKTYGDGTKTGRIKVSASYSDGSNVQSSTSSDLWSAGKLFVATKSDTVTVTVSIYSSSSSYAGTFAVALAKPSIAISDFEVQSSIIVNSICIDNNNDIYVAGSSTNTIDSYSGRDVRIKKYTSSGVPYDGWDKSYDWGHCDDEYATNIIFDGSKLLVYGIGNDLLSGSSKSDMWFKTLSISGTVLSEVVVDDTASSLLAVDSSNSIYLANGYYLYKYSSAGVLERTIYPVSSAPYMSYDSNPFGSSGIAYTVNIDGKIYAAGYVNNGVTSVSGYDWCIKQY